jgi:hypothetical protein
MSDGHCVWEGEHGRVEIRQLAPAFVVVELVGRADDYAVAAIRDTIETLTAIPDVEMYWDASQLEAFSNGFRAACTEYILANRKTIKTLAVLSHSALIAMAVSTTNLVLGGIVSSYRDTKKFVADKRAAAAQHGITSDRIAS